MRPLFPRLSLRSRFAFSCALLLAVGLLGACDRHSATEVPESYGHGSSREPSYDNHQIDSEKNHQSFSDTHGIDTSDESGKEGEHKDAAKAEGSPEGRFGLPNGK